MGPWWCHRHTKLRCPLALKVVCWLAPNPLLRSTLPELPTSTSSPLVAALLQPDGLAGGALPTLVTRETTAGPERMKF